MQLIFSDRVREDYLYWQAHDRKLFARINKLIDDTTRHPLEGIGKPEPWRHGLAGYWSPRINDEHRMVYKPMADALLMAQLRYHH